MMMSILYYNIFYSTSLLKQQYTNKLLVSLEYIILTQMPFFPCAWGEATHIPILPIVVGWSDREIVVNG